MTKKKSKEFQANTAAEREFYRALKKVGQHSGHIVEAYTEGASIKDLQAMTKALEDYSKAITPWAIRQSEKMLSRVQKKNYKAYEKQSKEMSKLLKSELGQNIGQKDVGRVAYDLLHEQVALIKSLPLEAGYRAQRIAAQNFLEGTRAVPDPGIVDELRKEMGMSTEVAINRAKLIARTETARANASFVQARAENLGVTHYVWRTTMDGAERPAHKKMNGKVIAYDAPPTLSDGTTGHAGTFPNCRCWQDPVLPDALE